MARRSRVTKRQDDKQPDKPPRIEGDAPTDALAFGISTLGTSGLKESGGWIYEEFLPQLAGGKGVKLFAEMDKNSAAIGAIRKLVRDLTRQVDWSVLPNDKAADQTKAKRYAEFVEGARHDMDHSWADLISEALTMIEFGFAPCEITYKLRRGRGQPAEFNSRYQDGMIGWRSIELRAQETLYRWEYEPGTRRLMGLWQADFWGNGPRRTVYIPKERFVNFRTESTKNNPEGRPLFRNAVVPYMRLKHVETVEMIGVQRDLTGLPVMEVPLALLKANQRDPAILQVRADLEQQMGSLNRHEREYLIVPASRGPDDMPTGFAFRLEKSPGARQLDIVAVKNSYKTDIFQSCLAQFLQLGQNGNGGAKAQSGGEIDLFSLALHAILDSVREAFQHECIDRLCALNSIPPDYIPHLHFGDVQVADLGAVGTYVTALHNAGVLIPDDELGEHLYKIAGLPWTSSADKVFTADQLVTEALSPKGELSIGDGGGGNKDVDVELLNGAQLAALVQVVEAMTSGTLPQDSAATILQATLGLDAHVVDGILAPVQDKIDAGLMPPPPSPFGQHGGPPGAQGAPPRAVQPHEIGDPAAPGKGPGGVKLADQIVNEVMKALVKKGMAAPSTVASLLVARVQGKGQ